MRSKMLLHKLRPAHVAAGVTMLTVPGSAVALAATQADPQSAIQVHVDSRHLAFGGQLKLRGHTAPSSSGHPVDLEYARGHSSRWQEIGSSRIRPDGSFKLVATLKRSGLVRVRAQGSAPRSVGGTTSSGASTGSATGGNDPASGGSAAGAGGTAGSATTSAQPVVVGAKFELGARSVNVLGSAPAHVRGRLRPEVAGRRVTLLARSGGGWRQVASALTGQHGGFDLRYSPANATRQRLRVRFAGDGLNSAAQAYAGRVIKFRQSGASTYDDGGSTACGFHAQFGVANRDLPCGTKVTFLYGGRSVTAVVDDRGPYVGGRDWDLNQNTAAALGFSGVDMVWSSL